MKFSENSTEARIWEKNMDELSLVPCEINDNHFVDANKMHPGF